MSGEFSYEDAMDTLMEKAICPACLWAIRECRCTRWCRECGVTTNHTTQQHQEVERDADARTDDEG